MQTAFSILRLAQMLLRTPLTVFILMTTRAKLQIFIVQSVAIVQRS
jgi:hypothetical protein